MNKHTISKEIITLIDNIKEQSNTIFKLDKAPQVELDLFLENVQKLYQKAILFNYLNSISDVLDEQLFVPPHSKTPNVEVKPDLCKSVEISETLLLRKVQRPTIADLTKAIGLNDKFLFTNKLFAGNSEEYNMAIQQLNSAPSLESAMGYFMSLQQLYKWDPENETVNYLLNLVDRRYS